MIAYRLRQLFFIVWVGASVFGGGAAGYWYLFDDEIPYEYDEAASSIYPDPVEQGGAVTADWKLTIKRICPATSTRVLRDADTGRLITTYDAVPAASSVKIDDQRLRRTFTLPTGLPPRVAYSSRICFICNPVQSWYEPICTNTPTLIINVMQDQQKDTRLRGMPY